MHNFIALAFLAYAPWHGTQTLGALSNTGVEFGPLKTITWPGVLNFFWIVVMMTFVITPALVKSFREQKAKRYEWGFLAFPILSILNSRKLDSLTIVAIENQIFYWSLLTLWLRRNQLREHFKLLIEKGATVLGLSYALALILPAIIPIDGHSPWGYFFPVERYIGWHGEGAPYSVIGMCLVILGAGLIFKSRNYWALALIGLIGIRLNVQRTSMIAAFLGLSTLTFIRRHKSPTEFRELLTLAILCLMSLFTGKMWTKSFYITGMQSTWDISARQKNMNNTVDAVVATSGRLDNAKLLAPTPIDQKNSTHENHHEILSLLFGHGTGAAPRLLRERSALVREPNCDYLRMKTEHGLLGLSLFILLHLFLAFNLKGSDGIALCVALGFMLIGENILVLPTYGSGPIILSGFILSL